MELRKMFNKYEKKMFRKLKKNQVNRMNKENIIYQQKNKIIIIITKSMRALWLVNQLWVIVPVNARKNRASSELLYKSNRPQVSITNERVARVGNNHFISNKGGWNNYFRKFSNRVLPPIFISTILQSARKENF